MRVQQKNGAVWWQKRNSGQEHAREQSRVAAREVGAERRENVMNAADYEIAEERRGVHAAKKTGGHQDSGSAVCSPSVYRSKAEKNGRQVRNA